MTVIFFKTNIKQVIKFVDSIENSCAFWYSPGLLSYKFLEEALVIDNLLIEETIFEDFKKDYPQFISKYTVETFKSETDKIEQKGKICFFASNDTIMRSFKSVLSALKDNVEYDVFCREGENALGAAQKLDIKATAVKLKIPDEQAFSLFVGGNDWGPLERKINYDFISKGINTICLQESSIDFNPKDGRMRTCSLPIFQGTATLENLSINNRICAIIGNPRFEELKPSPMPEHNKALINVNFTYGIFEDQRDSWVNDIVGACADLNIDYVLSQHPRDKGVFPNYKVLKSNPLLVHDSIRDCSVVISRFSALLTEAICLGRPAIYYNPHGENMHYKFQADNKMFFYATNKEELIKALSVLAQAKEDGVTLQSDFLEKHLGNTTKGLATEYISLLLQDAINFEPIKKSTLLQRLSILAKIYFRKILKKPF